jgi:small-conductance mechanosensitive channel
MIGLITAAVTVVMKDFIVAFLGWFTLMGKDGISVGDWVEIEGVTGEVMEIGLLKTVLFELGNWTASGLPTGRRVAFSNSFAMQGHYFNFSTSGQWLWDEIHLALPREVDPWEISQRIREIVEKETEPYTTEAAREWQSVVRHYGTREFSAAPAVNLRPASGGLEVVVRYITRAPERNALQATLLRAMVELVRSSEAASKERVNA